MATIEQIITDNIDVWSSAIKTKSKSGRGRNKKADFYGVRQLRDLILALAVRGVLVPQDKTDEPANILLEKISAKQEKLIKEKKIKKPKPLSPINNNEVPFELPYGWSNARLGGFVSIIRGITFPASKKMLEPAKGLIACLRTANVQHHIDWNDLIYVDEGFVKRDDQYLAAGDIVMSMANSRELVGKVSFADKISTTKATFGGFLSVIRPYFINPNFLMCVLRAPHIKEEMIGSASQTTNIANISLEKLNPIVISVPPLKEQHRIVAKVDELMTLCDRLEQQTADSLSAHQTLVETLLGALTSAADHESFQAAWLRIAEHFDILFTTEDSVEQLKQAIFQLAVMGKLVPQDPNDEPADELLKKIAAEKAQLVKDKKIKKQKPLSVISEDEKPFELRQGWEWARFGMITITRLGKMLDKAKNKGEELPYLRNTNVQWHRFDLDDIKLMKIDSDEKKELLLRKGDLLICEGGEPGRCAIWQDQSTEMYFQKALHRARPLGNVLSEYIQLCLTVDAFSGELDKHFTGATIKHFVGARLNDYIISLPPLLEQRRIVSKVQELTCLLESIKNSIAEAQITRLNLADTITKQAVS